MIAYYGTIKGAVQRIGNAIDSTVDTLLDGRVTREPASYLSASRILELTTSSSQTTAVMRITSVPTS